MSSGQNKQNSPMIYSIGHGNRSWPTFLELLKSFKCKYLIDVRSFPKSKFNPSFDRENLEEVCQKVGIKYVFMGDVLGGRPHDKSLYDDNGKTDYSKVEKSKSYINGITRLKKAAELSEKTFMMCSELSPSECHRSKLIGRTLAEIGISVTHIDKNGTPISQDDAIFQITNGQSDLFGTAPDITKSRGKYA